MRLIYKNTYAFTSKYGFINSQLIFALWELAKFHSHILGIDKNYLGK